MASLGYYVLDVAHGENISGKESPDGKFKEYKWSREFAKMLFDLFNKNNIRGEIYPKTDIVPTYKDSNGIIREILSKRVEYYNNICKNEKIVIVISNHVNASAKTNANGKPDWDYMASGFEVFTSKTNDLSDEIAKIFGKNIVNRFQDIIYRYGEKKSYYKEENFTILSGNDKIKPKYFAILIENLFMNNKKDLEKLNDFNFFVPELAKIQLKSILEVELFLKKFIF